MTRYIQSICYKCDPRHYTPGKTIQVDNEGCCTSCERDIMTKICNPLDSKIYANVQPERENYYREKLKRWDTYFYSICVAVASKSPCLSRQIGAILVRNKRIVSTGFNGPPVNYPHCLTCPRKEQGFKSGEGLHICPATHAEGNCIATAALNGISTLNTALYMNCIIPCKDCMALLINAGVKEIIVVSKSKPYHYLALEMAKHTNIKIREFIL